MSERIIELTWSPCSLNMRCKYKSFGCYYESIHSSPPSGSLAIRGGKIVYCEKVDFLVSEVILFYRLFFFFPSPTSNVSPPALNFSLLFFSLLVPCVLFFFLNFILSTARFLRFSLSLPLTLPRFFFSFLTRVPTHLSGRAVPGAMWQPRCLLGGPVPVRGRLDWRCVRPESVPSSLRRTRPVPRWDLHLSAWLGGRAL